MNNAGAAIRNKLCDYIRVADDKKLYAIYNLLEDEIEDTNNWWKDKQFIQDLDDRFLALENESDKGLTVEQLRQSIVKLRTKKYGK